MMYSRLAEERENDQREIIKQRESEQRRIIEERAEYQVEQNPNNIRWSAVTHPTDKDKAQDEYFDHVRQYPNVQFRIVEIKTVKTVIVPGERLEA